MGISELLLNITISFVEQYGIFGISILSFFEIIFTPLPSEFILPLAGYIAFYKNNFLFLVFSIIFSSLFATIGSFFWYFIGKYSYNFVLKYGKYFLIRKKNLDKASKWFDKYGSKTILICRCVPGLRSLISIPAGLLKMNLKKYFILSFAGFTIWSSVLVLIGYFLKENWTLITKYSNELDLTGILIILALIIYFLIKHLKQQKHTISHL